MWLDLYVIGITIAGGHVRGRLVQRVKSLKRVWRFAIQQQYRDRRIDANLIRSCRHENLAEGAGMLGLKLDDCFVRGHLSNNVPDVDRVPGLLEPLFYRAAFEVGR